MASNGGSGRPANPLPRRLPSSSSAGTAVPGRLGRAAAAAGAAPGAIPTSTPAPSHAARYAHLHRNGHSNHSSAQSNSLSYSGASASRSRSLLDLEQHNTSTVALSPRTAPRRKRKPHLYDIAGGDADEDHSRHRRGAPRAIASRAPQDSSVLGAGRDADLSGLALTAAQGNGNASNSLSHASITTRNGSRRLVSTPVSNGDISGLRGGRTRVTRGSLLSNQTSSSASTSGILGNDSLATGSSSPPPVPGSESLAVGQEYESDEADYLSDASSSASDTPWTLVDRMRVWRNDALTQHLYSTAIFWGSKIFTKTRDPNDGFWLAQSYFAASMFSRAERVLMGAWAPPADVTGEHDEEAELAHRRREKGKGRAAADSMNVDAQSEQRDDRQALRSSTTERGEDDRALPVASGDLDTPTIGAPSAASTIQAATNARARIIPGTAKDPVNRPEPSEHGNGAEPTALVRLADISVACRYLAAQSLVRQEKWSQAMYLLGDVNPFRRLGAKAGQPQDAQQYSGDGGVKFEASMCHLRGVIQLHLNAAERAKECFVEALAIDVKCYESFETLVAGNMMDVNEEWAFIQSLAFKEQTPEDADFIRMIYTIRLKKYAHREEMDQCGKALTHEHGLADDPDVLFGLADELYEAMRYADCFQITSKILSMHDSHAATLPLHLACMHHLPHLRSALFLLAHELVDREPESVISWYAVGLWYYSTGKWEESRRYFGKGLLIDNRFGPAWITFAHSFALEGEHDQAITAYSTAQRHFQGTHLPIMFIGMQYLLLSNIKAASEYLDAAYSMCQTDPLLLNERGVTAFYNEAYQDAINLFALALQHAESVQSSPAAWATTHMNMGQAYRKLGNQEAAVACFKRTLDLEPRNWQAHAALGVSYLYAQRREEAIMALHDALSLQPGEASTTALLRLALQDSLDHEMNPENTGSLRFPQLSAVAAEEMERQLAEEEAARAHRRTSSGTGGEREGDDRGTEHDHTGFGGATSGAASSSPHATRRSSTRTRTSKRTGVSGGRVSGSGSGRRRNANTAEVDMPVERNINRDLDESALDADSSAAPSRRTAGRASRGGAPDRRRSSYAGGRRQARHEENDDDDQEDYDDDDDIDENEDSTEDMVDASMGSDMVD